MNEKMITIDEAIEAVNMALLKERVGIRGISKKGNPETRARHKALDEFKVQAMREFEYLKNK